MQSAGGIVGFLTGANDAGMQMFVVFDSPYNAYYVGQNVTGRIVVRLEKPKTFRNIQVVFKGEANVEWQEDRTETDKDGHSRTVTDHYTGNERYFENTLMVAGGAVGEMELQPGEFSYPFNFPLPQNIPSSFEGEYGHIRYTIKAIMNRPWKFDHECKSAFTVVSPLDLNTIASVKEPVLDQQSKTFCCCCCKSGPLEMTVELPCSGYVPGQTIPFKVDVENSSNVMIFPVNVVLRKEVTWTATSPSYKQKVEKVVIANVAVDDRVEPHTHKVFSQDIKIPPVPPSNLQNCRIIDLEYVFKVSLIAHSYHRNLSARIPITLGTVPLLTGPTKFVAPVPAPVPVAPTAPSAPEKGELPSPAALPGPAPPGQPGEPGFRQPSGDPSVAPSAPPLYPDLPPPSYEESVFGGKNIKDANDGEHTQGLTDFVPRYPVWNFDQQK